MHHPIGILKVMHRLHLSISSDVMNLILEAAEAFSISSIKRCSLLSNSQRELILKAAMNPISLKHLVRVTVRHFLGDIGHSVIEKIDLLPIPALIKRYLLYEI
jgi:hypothetical protein